jgi:hypothetical protein
VSCQLFPRDAETVLSALQDAAEGNRDRAAHCSDCATAPADLCDLCADRLSRADNYDQLASEIWEHQRRAGL